MWSLHSFVSLKTLNHDLVVCLLLYSINLAMQLQHALKNFLLFNHDFSKIKDGNWTVCAKQMDKPLSTLRSWSSKLRSWLHRYAAGESQPFYSPEKGEGFHRSRMSPKSGGQKRSPSEVSQECSHLHEIPMFSSLPNRLEDDQESMNPVTSLTSIV